MNPFPDRIDQLHAHLAHRYAQHDRQATEIIMTAMLDPALTRMARPWIIIETDYPSRDTTGAWFSFGGEALTRSMAEPRLQRRTPCEQILSGWIDTKRLGAVGLFIESEWRKLHDYVGVGRQLAVTLNQKVLAYSCIRLRVLHPRGDYALRLDRTADHSELARLTRRVFDRDLRAALTPHPPSTDVPPAFLYYCELLQRLSPHLLDWECLTGSLAAVARGIAVLYGDGRPPDWAAVERILRDCVNYQTGWIIKQAASPTKSRGVKAWQLFKASGHIVDRPFLQEIRRLARDGILQRLRAGKGLIGHTYHPGQYALLDKVWLDLVDRERKIL